MRRLKFQRLETVARVAPLGVRFRDVVTDTLVGDGLSVTVYPAASPARRVAALSNRSGVYVLHRAPGVRAFEQGEGDAAFAADAQPPLHFVVEVEDLEHRFLPFSFAAELPFRGLYNWTSPLDPAPASPPDPPRNVPLYSSPTRRAPAGMAVVRAELRDPVLDAPAAWAVVEARLDGQMVARGFSDELGRLALIFPYPAPLKFPPVSPPASPPTAQGPPLMQQEWHVTLSAAYAPQSPPSPPASDAAGATAPDLRATLAQLLAPPADLWLHYGNRVRLTGAVLRYGQELVLQSQDLNDNSPPAPESVLFVTPAP
jgi:hypothetical protein